MRTTIASNIPFSFTHDIPPFPVRYGSRLWLDGNDSTVINTGTPLDGDFVSDWLDKSGNSFDFVQPTMLFQPLWNTSIFGTNNNNAVVFGSILREMYRLTFSGTNASTLFALHVAFEYNPVSGASVIYSDDRLRSNANAGSGVVISIGGTGDLNFVWGGTLRVIKTGMVVGTPYILSVYTQQNGGNVDIYARLNGVEELASLNQTPPTLSVQDTQIGKLGTNSSTEETIAEIFTVGVEKTQAEVEIAEEYLNTRHGVF